jgi:hypothetical protein
LGPPFLDESVPEHYDRLIPPTGARVSMYFS